jgi:hypothetical protein
MPIHLSFHHWNSTYDWHRRRIGDLSATWGGEFTRCWQNGNGKHPRYPRSFHTDDYTSAFRLGPHKYVSWGNDGYATPDTPLSEHHVVGKSLYRNRYRFIIATSCTRCRKHAMIANIIGNVLNIVLDYLLIIYCSSMGETPSSLALP